MRKNEYKYLEFFERFVQFKGKGYTFPILFFSKNSIEQICDTDKTIGTRLHLFCN